MKALFRSGLGNEWFEARFPGLEYVLEISSAPKRALISCSSIGQITRRSGLGRSMPTRRLSLTRLWTCSHLKKLDRVELEFDAVGYIRG